ncbi:hypothetical protein BH09CHL1_BH09CHL1_32550 [soil metagenome]
MTHLENDPDHIRKNAMITRSVLLLLVVIAGFSAALTESPLAKTSNPTQSLTPGLHLGFGTFAPISQDQAPVLDLRVAEAVAAGMDVARVMVDWAEFETANGEYDWSTINDQVERIPKHAALFLTFSITDVDHYSVPGDLLTADQQLATPLNTPDVIERYTDALSEFLPSLVSEHELFAVSVANEPDVLLADRPESEATALAEFTTAIGAFLADSFPEVAVSITISGGGVIYPAEFLDDLIAATEVAAFNWGCIDPASFKVTAASSIPDEIELLVATAAGREIIIQELTCAAGYTEGPSTIGSSEELQATWFDRYFQEMSANPTFRAAFVFDLIDWPEDLAKTYSDFLRAEGLDDIADRYEELQRTWGLLTFDDLEAKPAWSTFIAALKSQK